MKIKKSSYLKLILAINIAGVLILVGLLGVSSAFANDQIETLSVQQSPLQNSLHITIFFTETVTSISDLSGNVIGEGEYGGRLACISDHCSQKTHLSFTDPFIREAAFEYRFTDLLALDPATGVAVVEGSGTVISENMREKFKFTATIQDNHDGTLLVRYISSRPDASFSLQAAGWIRIFMR